MANSSEQQSRSSKNGSETLYDRYQRGLPSEEKSSRGKFQNGLKFFNASERGGDRSSKKDHKQAETPAADPNGKAAQTQNNGGEGSSSQKRKFPKIYYIPPKVRGFDCDERSLEIMLLEDGKDDSFKKIGVVGLPGVGKTTLCKSILKNARVKSRYGRLIWVSLSDVTIKPVNETIEPADDIIDLGKSDEHELHGLLGEANEHFKEKYLIVLDDVGEREIDSYYEALKDCIDELPRGKGGAVIVTSRSEEAAKKVVGDKNLHRLLPLSDQKSCWFIYADAVEGVETSESETTSKDVMEELMRRSGGLPGAAQMMGKIKGEKKKNSNK